MTDLAAVGELSRQSHAPDPENAGMRTLGLPVGASHVSVFSLFRLPLGALLPSDLLYVYEERGRVAGLARVEHESVRDEWTIVELDAIDNGTAGDIRYRLVQHLLRDASKRGGIRFHVACADESANVDLFMQAGFARYGEERILYRAPDKARAKASGRSDPAEHGIRPVAPIDALQLDRLVPQGDADAGGAPRGLPTEGLGAAGWHVARAALVAHADPAFRRRRGVRPARAAHRARASSRSARSAWPRKSSRTTCA